MDTSQLAAKVAQRFAKKLGDAEFDKLVAWIGPKSHRAHRKFPKGRREFDTDTRIFRFNIHPDDYLRFSLDESMERMREGAKLADVVNPEAYAAMKDVLADLKRKRVKFEMVKMPWRQGGSFIEAVMPMPKGSSEPEERPDDPWQRDYGIR